MPKATKWTGLPDQIDEIEQKYRRGETVRAISRELSCRSDLVSDALRERGYNVSRGREKILPDDKERLIERYRDGATFRALGEEFGMSSQAVSDLLKREGVKTAKWETWTIERDTELLALLESGVSQSEAARRMGTSQRAVNYRARQLGVPPQGPRSGPNHGGWKGGRVKMGGYVYVKPEPEDLPYAVLNSSGYVAEHRLVMGKSLGRPLLQSETVHHINGERADNRIENLQLRQGQHGSGVVMECLDCGSHNVQATALV